MNGYGDFEVVLGVPDDFEGHRCAYAREVLRQKLGEGLVEALVIQQTIPCDPTGADDDREYYKFGGNIRMSRVE